MTDYARSDEEWLKQRKEKNQPPAPDRVLGQGPLGKPLVEVLIADEPDDDQTATWYVTWYDTSDWFELGELAPDDKVICIIDFDQWVVCTWDGVQFGCGSEIIQLYRVKHWTRAPWGPTAT